MASKPVSQPSVLVIDLLTPGALGRAHALGMPVTDPDLIQVHRAAVRSVAAGDFQEQLRVGRQLRDVAAEPGPLKASGLYLMGEGKRLLADLAGSDAARKRLHDEARSLYRESLEFDPNQARAVRGIARIDELSGDFDTALQLFNQARAMVMLQSTGPKPQIDTVYLGHENMRVGRHYIHCLLNLRLSSPANKWNSVRKRLELEGQVYQTENSHYEFMAGFRDDAWSQIEWFMGLVFLGRAWSGVGQIDRAVSSMTSALVVRSRLIPRNGKLSLVEVSNLQWWSNVADGIDHPSVRESAEEIRRCLEGPRERIMVRRSIADALTQLASPWELRHLHGDWLSGKV